MRKGHVNVKHNGEFQVSKSHSNNNNNLHFKGRQISTQQKLKTLKQTETDSCIYRAILRIYQKSEAQVTEAALRP